MTNKKSIKNLQDSINVGILSFMKEKGLNQVDFKNHFRIHVEESTYNDDYVRVPYVAKSLYQDGSVLIEDDSGTDTSTNIEFIDIYESAHILDELESGEYENDEDSL
jgi:hypothetical protein